MFLPPASSTDQTTMNMVRQTSQAASNIMPPAPKGGDAAPALDASYQSSESARSGSDGRSSGRSSLVSFDAPSRASTSVSERTNRLSSAVIDAANSSKTRLSRRRKEGQSLARLRLGEHILCTRNVAALVCALDAPTF